MCRFKYFNTTAIKIATAIYLSRLEELLIKINLEEDLKAEGNFSSNIGEKGL
jgi:hypothetical protein